MVDVVQVGVIGCGSVMQHAYMPLLLNQISRGAASSPVVCDIRSERLEEVRAQFPVSRTTSDPGEVIDDPDIDLVLVLTSMREHGDLAEQALLAGKHVLVEKPMSVDLAQAGRLVELDAAGPGMLLCAPHVLLSPDYQQLARLMASGRLGRPLLARARYGWDGPDWGRWFYEPGGGPIYDLGVYNVTTLTGLLGPVRRVSALATRSRVSRVVEGSDMLLETDDTYQILLEHDAPDGPVLATVTTAFGMQQYRSPAVEIYGLHGTAQLMGDDWAPDGLEVWENAVGAWAVHGSRSRYWPWTDGLRHLIDCIRTGARPYPRPAHARHVLEVMQAAMTSAETGQVVEVSSTFAAPPPMPEHDRAPAHLIHDRVHEDAQ